jgi:single-strand DNA-binding protein
MRGINRVTIVGTVGKDPEIRYFQSGDAYCALSVATTEQWKDKDGNKQEKTEWHRVKFTRKLAEIVGQYVRKGQQIYVEGKLETSKYTDKQGVERYSTDIVASEMQMLGGKKDGAESDNGWGKPADKPKAEPKPESIDPFDDPNIPF